MNRQGSRPRGERREENLADHERFTLDPEATAAAPGRLCLAQVLWQIVAVTWHPRDFEGIPLHAGVTEQYGTQRFAL